MMFDAQPTLKGDLVELRPLRTEDYEELRRAASDPKIWEQHPDQTRFTPDGFRVFFDRAMASGGALVAIDAKTRAVIGTSRYHGYNAQASEVEIGWTFLARSHWGGTYNGQMKRLMLEHAFKFVLSVVFIIGKENWRSQKAVEKIGGVRAGVRPDDTGAESLVYRLTASTFAERQTG
jgi:RimJ/RimL family protein N-acetyltransferase